MKIAIEAQRLFRKKKHGMDIVALELIRQLQQIDKINEYFIIVKPDEDNKVLAETENFHIIEIGRGPYPLWEQYYLPREIRKIKPDIVHCTSNTAPISINTALILTLHDIIFMNKRDHFYGSTYQQMGKLYRKWLLPQIINKCNKIITVSNFEKDNISAYFPRSSDKIISVYNATNTNFRPVEEKEIQLYYRNKYNLPDRFILFFGNTDPKKNFSTTLKALDIFYKNSKNTDTMTVIPDINRQYLKQTCNKLNLKHLNNRIKLTGYIPNDELAYIYNAAYLFLYPSLYESFGIPVIEAMACGVPVITSNRSAIPEIAGKAAILIDPDKPEQIASGITEILNNKVTHQQLKEKGIKRAANFSWDISALSILNIYKEIYNKKHFSKKLTIQ